MAGQPFGTGFSPARMYDLARPHYYYKVTAGVVSKAIETDCINYLKPKISERYIFPLRFQQIGRDLKEKFSSDAENVINALRKTKSNMALNNFQHHDYIYIKIN